MTHKSGSWDDLKIHVSNSKFDHVSFDFWRTMAFSNPKFKEARTSLFLSLNERMNTESVQDSFSKIGIAYNKGMEADNTIVSPEVLYAKVLDDLKVDDELHKDVVNKCYDLFLKYPPVLDPELKSILEILRASGCSISITSNTAFIPGSLIRDFIDDHLGSDIFNFSFFSDAVKFAKPSFEIFDLMYDYLSNDKILEKHNILHIGDNFDTDVKGAQNFGISSYLLH